MEGNFDYGRIRNVKVIKLAKKKHIELIVAEKDRAAEQIARALSGGNYKERTLNRVRVFEFTSDKKNIVVVGLRGHIFSTEFSKRVHEAGWRSIDPLYLLTKAPLSKVPRLESKPLIKILRNLAVRAKRVIIATDYDREGENIGMQASDLVIKRVNPVVDVKRAVFSSLSPNEIRRAFEEENLRELNQRMVDASEVRQEIDLRMGVAFTRLATMAVQDALGTIKTGLISIGPCQTPTLGLIVEKYMQHLESVRAHEREVRYRVKLLANFDSGEMDFLSEKSFSDIDEARRYGERLVGGSLVIVDVQRERKRIRRPLPLNTPRLASLASRVFKMSSKKALDVAEQLYLEGLITYPRTETDRYKGSELVVVKRLAEEARKKGIIGFSGQIDRPRNGKSDDMAHPPIRPERVIEPERVKSYVKRDGVLASKLYELILRHFIANLLQDGEIEEFRLSAKVDGEIFKKSAYKIIRKGFLEVYMYHDLARKKEEEINKTPIKGARLKIKSFRIVEERPKIIEPISESELVRLMDKLGIGTDATFADHIQKNVDRRYIERRGGRLIPTKLGLSMYISLKKTAPELLDPSIRSKMERWFKEVEVGQRRPREVVREAIKEFKEIFLRFRDKINYFARDIANSLIEVKRPIRKKRRKKKR